MNRKSWRSSRLALFLVTFMLCMALIVCSTMGVLTSVEGIAASPLNGISGFFTKISNEINRVFTDLSKIQNLQERNLELEEQLALLQIELIELREVANDYNRLAELLEYSSNRDDLKFVTADVIAVDQSGFTRSITINRGSRDGFTTGMAVVTELGLVGRITELTANASQVQLIADVNSAIASRLQTSRVQGSVVGLLTGNLRMELIPLGQEIILGDLVVTSGLGGNLPADLVLGQVTSVRQFEFELYQEAEVRSFIDFNTLETVMVITSFEPVDLSVFKNEEN